MVEPARVFGLRPFPALRGPEDRWWIGGGVALELFAERSWRPHGDVDIYLDAPTLDRLITLMSAGRDPRAKTVRGWRESGGAEPLVVPPRPQAPLPLELHMVPEARRDWRTAGPQGPWRTGVRSIRGVHFLAPELVLFAKSGRPILKDDLDLAAIAPLLEAEPRRWLLEQLRPGHPWRPLLEVWGQPGDSPYPPG